MFSFRRRSSKKGQEDGQVRTSPSLPELNPQGIPWPENLVDVDAIRQRPSLDARQRGAAKTSIQGSEDAPIPFHKPFRGSPGKPDKPAPISAFYMSSPPSAFDKRRGNGYSTGARPFQRRAPRVPTTFNLMVVGGRNTGKTSLLRLLLETADISPTAPMDQRTAMDRFLRGTPKHTHSIQSVCVEICESRFDRVLFSVIDTPGLDFLEGRELKLERQVNGILKYVDAQYSDTMSEESKVIRKNKGDQHIHLCIYMIDPSSVMTAAQRRTQSSLPTKTRSETTLSYRTPDLIPDTSSVDSDDESLDTLTMSPAELRVIRRLSARCNVLTVIAHSDSLTDDRLAAVKHAVRKDLEAAGVGFGVFTASPSHKPAGTAVPPPENGHGNGSGASNGVGFVESDEDDDTEDSRSGRPVIKLRSARLPTRRSLSRSRSRRDLSEASRDDRRPISPDVHDKESVANVRFSAHIVAKPDLSSLLPFALIAPEANRRRQRPLSSDGPHTRMAPSSPSMTSEDGLETSMDDLIPGTPVTSNTTRSMAYLQGPPDDLKGVFVRKFRWGTIDVLDPDHCDFAALRTAVLSTHLKVLKVHTKEVLYEKYRTEKLLARRATRHITPDERERMFEDLGL